MSPSPFSLAVDTLVSGVRPTDLREAARRLSRRYLEGPTRHRPAVRSLIDAQAYAAARAPATYAAAHAALSEIRSVRPHWQPRHMVDAGAGPGTATWAALDIWPAIATATLVEQSPHMLSVGRRLDNALDHNCVRVWKQDPIDIADLPEADLVVASYVLGELTSPVQAAAGLWARADTLAVIEPGTPGGFGVVRACRSAIVGLGGNVLAPCTHGGPCPLSPPDWCHFARRLSRTGLHRYLEDADRSYEDEKFSYVALTRDDVAVDGCRVVRPPRSRRGVVSLTTCSVEGVTTVQISRRDGTRYRAARRMRWGDHGG